jgi:hypothetical protein
LNNLRKEVLEKPQVSKEVFEVLSNSIAAFKEAVFISQAAPN